MEQAESQIVNVLVAEAAQISPTRATVAVGAQAVAPTAPANDSVSKFTRLLSIEEGKYFIPEPEKRKLFALLTDVDGRTGEMLVSASHVMDHGYRNYKSLTERYKEVSFVERRVTLQDLDKVYRQASVALSSEGNELEQRLMLKYIQKGVELGASDLRIYITHNTTIRYKVHNRGRSMYWPTREEGFALVRALYNSMCVGDPNLDESREQDALLKPEFCRQCGLASGRIATRPADHNGLLLTMRLQTEVTDQTTDLESAGFLPLQRELYDIQIDRSSGSMWLSGVTGSGKTTTLATALRIQQRKENYELDSVTIEDPIEINDAVEGVFRTPHTYDRNNHEDSSEAWPRGIKSLMRHAPNVVLAGEVRDKAAANAALDFTLTGHNMFTTIHVDRFFNIPLRLIEMGVNKGIALNASLVTFLSNQGLVRILCEECKRPLREHRSEVRPEILRKLDQLAQVDLTIKPDELFIAAPFGSACKHCSSRGTNRRKVAAEVCIPDATFMNFLRAEDPMGALQYFVHELDGVTKLAHGLIYMRAGQVDPSHLDRDILSLVEDIRTVGVRQ
jgi:type II secretory ATPase GspE/PulE/Tfp pilus assembly ATPase PilB-like protein